MKSSHARAVDAIRREGIVLVFPIRNRNDLPSLWHAFHPRSEMRWEWDAHGDGRVVELWHLRMRLARSSDVAYAKWFRGRATFFSLPVLHALLGSFASADVMYGLPREAVDILEVLRESSPRSTKELRAEVDLRGKAFEGIFHHAMKALWSRLLIVGAGEVEDGAFPSLAVAATETMFEDLWLVRHEVPPAAQKKLAEVLAATPAFARELSRCKASIIG
ncbi:MAG: hypothetical protein FWD69_05010 [Polyangiaceae bacterium]|nr:hypothetical protein [Polyangiaceae bacterium]